MQNNNGQTYNYLQIEGIGYQDNKNVVKSVNDSVRYMLDRTQTIFDYEGLPETVPARMLELYLQSNGQCVFAEHEGNYYVFIGGMGGAPDVYYMPTLYTVANPALKLTKIYEIDKNCVLIMNDALMCGLLPLCNKYASLLADNDISMRIADINSRLVTMIKSHTDNGKKSADIYIKKIEKGDLSVVADQAFLDGVSVSPLTTASQSNTMSQLIEYQQYLKASWFNELGMNANYNMKRESLNSNEAQLNDDILLPLIQDMLKCREIAIEKINKMFNLNISVTLNSIWAEKEAESEHFTEMMLEDPTDPEDPKDPEEKGEE